MTQLIERSVGWSRSRSISAAGDASARAADQRASRKLQAAYVARRELPARIWKCGGSRDRSVRPDRHGHKGRRRPVARDRTEIRSTRPPLAHRSDRHRSPGRAQQVEHLGRGKPPTWQWITVRRHRSTPATASWRRRRRHRIVSVRRAMVRRSESGKCAVTPRREPHS